MSLSRKHYQAVADILKAERTSLRGFVQSTNTLPDKARGYHHERADAMSLQIDRLEESLSVYFQSDNPNFRPDTFRKAAQP